MNGTPDGSRSSPLKRGIAVIGAAIGIGALVLQLYLSIGLATQGGRPAAWGVFMYLGYFTILTNILVVLALLAAAGNGQAALWRFFRRPGVASAIATNIAVVGLTYFLVLRHIWNPRGLLLVADVALHYVMPIYFIAYWCIAVPAREVHWRDIPTWWIYPLAYLAYALVRGAIAGTYPYPFIDVAALGYARTALNAAGILAAFTALAALVVALGKKKQA